MVKCVQVFGMLIVRPLMLAGTAAVTPLILVNNDMIIHRTGLGFAPLVMPLLMISISGMLCVTSMFTENHRFVTLVSELLRCVQVFGLLIVWPLMVAGTAAATYLIVVNNDVIIARTGFGFAPLVMLSLVSVISGMLCTLSVVTEDWHPRMRTNVSRCCLYDRCIVQWHCLLCVPSQAHHPSKRP